MMGRNRYFIFALLMLCCLNVSAQRKWHKTKPAEENNILWQKTITRCVLLSENAHLLSLKDSSGRTVHINSLIAAAFKGRSTPRQHIFENNVAPMNDSLLQVLADTALTPAYIILEDWTFRKDSGKMVVTVSAIGPCSRQNYLKQKAIIQQKKEVPCDAVAFQPLFYLHLPPIFKTYAGSVKGTPMSCYDIFATRQYSGNIICIKGTDDAGSTFDASKDQWVY